MVSDDYETSLLGSVLHGYPDVPKLTRIVSAGDFHQPRHAAIWQAILAVHATGEPVNPLTVMNQMGASAHRLPGGATYLSSLDCPVQMNADWLAERVHEKAVKQKVDDLGIRCRQGAADDDVDAYELVARVKAWTEDIGTRSTSGKTTMAEAFEQVVDVAEHGEPAATPTAWSDLDSLIGGWYPGSLIVVGARPGVGKSLMLENAATAVARRGKRVAFISLEMSAKELAQRTAAYTASVEVTKLRRGGALTEQDWGRLMKAGPQMSATLMDIYDSRHQTIDTIRAIAWETAQAAKREGQELGLVVVDYLQLITARRDRNLTRQQQVGEMSRGLKALAGELNVPVIAAAQLNRQSEARSSGVPVLSDLREAGDIEQDADLVILLHEEKVDDGYRVTSTGDITLIVAKQRHGQLGQITLHRWGHYGRIAA